MVGDVFKHIFDWQVIEDGDRSPFSKMKAIVDHAKEIGGLYIQCREELYNWIRNASRLQGSIPANLWVGLARLSLGEVEQIRVDLPRDITSQIIWENTPGFQAQPLGSRLIR